MKTWLMEGSAYAEDGCTWYTGDKINDDDIEVVKADLAQSLADALEGMIKAADNLSLWDKTGQSYYEARAALANYRKGE